MRRSIRMTSGRSARASASASGRPPPRRRPRNPAPRRTCRAARRGRRGGRRRSGSGSGRVTASVRRTSGDRGHARGDRRAAAGLRLDRERPATPLDPLAHRWRDRSRGPARRRGRRSRREPDPVVADVERDDVAHVRQREARPGSRRRAWRRWPAPPARSAAARPRPPGAVARRRRSTLNVAGTPLTAPTIRRPRRRTPPAGFRRPACDGRERSTARRASARLSRARRAPRRCVDRGSTGRSLAWAAASSWVTIPIRPCAMVSWISRAIRCRSSSTPASRACVSSWACSPAFSSSATSSRARRLAALLVLLGDLLADDRAAADDDGLDGDDRDVERPGPASVCGNPAISVLTRIEWQGHPRRRAAAAAGSRRRRSR